MAYQITLYQLHYILGIFFFSAAAFVNIGLGINASVNGGDYKEQFVYYEIKDFGKGNVESVESFLNKYLGGYNEILLRRCRCRLKRGRRL